MRLIDADAFLERTRKDPLFPLVERYGLSRVIENEPTVEAIPIDWLTKRYCAAGVFASPSYHKRADIVRQIIRDWRRENEQVNSSD